MPKPAPSNTPIAPNLPDVYRGAFTWTESLTGQQAVNVLHFAAVTGTPVADVFDIIHDNVTGPMFDTIPETAVVTELVLEELVAGGQFYSAALSTWGGSSTNDDGYVPALSTLIRLSGLSRGQGMKGRIYLPFTQENTNANGKMPDVLAASISAGWNQFNTDLLAADLNWCIVSYMYRDPTTGDYVAPDFQGVNSASCDPIFATQRRRQDRVGL